MGLGQTRKVQINSRILLPNFWKNKEQNLPAEIITVYNVTIPSWVVWPWKVIVNVSYTREAAEQFIEDYPNRFLVPFMRIESQEIRAFRETD